MRTDSEIDVTEADVEAADLKDDEVVVDLRRSMEEALVLADRIRDEGTEEGDTVIDRGAATTS